MQHTAIAITFLLSLSAESARPPETAGPPRGPDSVPLYAFCGTGDHLWVWNREPVDGPAAVDAMFDWLARTYHVRRMYWRGAQSMMWDRYFRFGPEKPLQYDWTMWKRHLYRDEHINETAVEAAHRRGMEIFMYTGLFESGVPPDIGIIGPYLIEDSLCIEHPEWRPLDRWGERGGPGMVCFAESGLRRALVDRYVRELDRRGYDGINFYTYVENCAIRYEDEYGYNPPIIAELRRFFPDVDPAKRPLTPEQKEKWYDCRGTFLTQFLRELHAALHPRGKKVSVILDARDPDFPQPWWGRKLRGTGRIRMQWRTWIREGIVDELWVQIGPPAAQRATLDRLLKVCKGTSVRLTVRTPIPFNPSWKPYIARGVVPVAVLTAPRNGIERLTLAGTSADTLDSPDWRLRAQTVTDAAAGRIRIPPERIASLAGDPHLLVRRRVMMALAAMKARTLVPVLEKGLFDPESCVRIAAAESIGSIPGPDSPAVLLDAVAKDPYFQMKLAAVHALIRMGDMAFPQLAAGIRRPEAAVREVCVRALYVYGRDREPARVAPLLLAVVRNQEENPAVRYFAIEGLVGLRARLSDEVRRQTASVLLSLLSPETPATVRLQAAWGLGYLYRFVPEPVRDRIVADLTSGFRAYGDRCRLSDAAFGWRVFGNALLECGAAGRKRLDQIRTHDDDRWLAWFAYRTLYTPHRRFRIEPVSEDEAVRMHKQYAPPFPGHRRW